jgi:hypothetical protein
MDLSKVIIDFIVSPLGVTIEGGIVVLLVGYYIFGIGRSKSGDGVNVEKSSTIVNGDNNITNSIVTNVYEQSFREEKIVNNPPNLSKLSPLEIHREVNSRPLYQQDDAGKNYIGNKITWKLSLADIRKYKELLTVSGAEIDSKKMEVAVVTCEVKEKQYPRLQTLNKNDIFYITGSIASVTAYGIEVKDCILSFLE